MERTLDRLPSLNPKRLTEHHMRGLELVSKPLISKTWNLGVRLDQGREGACVGFSWSQECNASPVAIGRHIITYDFAFGLFTVARRDFDPWYGEDYEGTSVDAGAAALKAKGYMLAYKWATKVEEIALGVAYEGPGVAGTYWKSGMFEPRPSGLLEVTGSNEGGHAWLIRGVVLKPRLKGETRLGPCFAMTNTWGHSWGQNGTAYITFEDMERLLGEDGEFCLPIGRQDPHIKAPVFA